MSSERDLFANFERMRREMDEFFGDDGFHPSATGYVSMVAALFPAIAHASGVADDDDSAMAYTPGTVLPVSFAAKQAAHRSGTEVTGATVGGRDRGPGGRWAAIRRIRR